MCFFKCISNIKKNIMKTTITLFIYALVLALSFGSCDNNDDYSVPIAIPTPTPTPTPNPTSTPDKIEGEWSYYEMNKTVNGVTSPEEIFNTILLGCGIYDYIDIGSGIIRIGVYNPVVNGCDVTYFQETWTLLEDRYRIPIVVGYKIINGKTELVTDFFELVSISDTELKLTSYPKTEGDKIIVINIILTKGWDY